MMGRMGDQLGSEDAKALASSLRRLMQLTANLVEQDGEAAPLIARLRDHLGCELAQVLSVATRFEAWEHVNLQRGVDAYLAEHTPDAEWFGVGGQHRGHEDIMGMLLAARHSVGYGLGAADYATAAVGPEDSVEVVQLGLVPTTAPDGTPVLVGIRDPTTSGRRPAGWRCSRPIARRPGRSVGRSSG